MTTVETTPAASPSDRRGHVVGYFYDELARPFVTLTVIALTVVQWPSSPVLVPAAALPLLVVAALGALAVELPRPPWGESVTLVVAAVAMLAGAVLFPLVQATSGTILAFVTASAIGARVASRTVALGLVTAGATTAAGVTALVGATAPDASSTPWWLALTVGLPVFVGLSQRDRREALQNARRATEEARRSSESEAREAALVERSRIAGEIHDVLGHSLSGIALQLDLADALVENGRPDEAAGAVRRARAIAVDGMGETRRAVHALAGDDEPVTDTVRRLAERAGCTFDVVGEPTTVSAPSTHAVVRTVQEALTNAMKYAPGAPRSIRLALDRDPVTLTVQNGPASGEADAVESDGTGAGLSTMRERAARLGGTLHAGPTPDGGWTVDLELPR